MLYPETLAAVAEATHSGRKFVLISYSRLAVLGAKSPKEGLKDYLHHRGLGMRDVKEVLPGLKIWSLRDSPTFCAELK